MEYRGLNHFEFLDYLIHTMENTDEKTRDEIIAEIFQVRDKAYVRKLEENADAGKPETLWELARIYRYGKANTCPDGYKAIKYFEKVGDFKSIAEIYRDGRFMEPSGADAIDWFTKILKDKTLPDHERYSAAFEIAKIFHEGKGVPRSDSEAVKYFKLSAKAGTVTARVAYNNLAKIYSKSDELTPNIGMVLHWLKKAAEVGSRRATWILAKVFRDGKFGVRQNGTKALEILQDGASNPFDIINKVAAMRMIAEIYDKGLGIPEDKEKAADLYQEATSINEEWMQTINALQMRI